MAIYLVWGAPSQGKSYYVTAEAVQALKKGKKVFSNYPIIHKIPLRFKQKVINLYRKLRKKELIKNKYLSSYVWKNEYFDTGIYNAMIVLDEAYKTLSISSHARIEPNQHSFFASNGKDGNNIYLIAHHYVRINLVVREMAEYYVNISKMSNPLSIIGSGKRDGQLTPLFFTAEIYLTEEDFKYRRLAKTIYQKKHLWFSKGIAESYDTRWWGSKEKENNYVKWIDVNPEEEKQREKEEEFKKEFIGENNGT